MNGRITTSTRRTPIAWAVLFAFMVLTPWVVMGVARVRSNTTDMKQWLPDGREQVQRYQSFVAQFGVDDFVLATWDGCSADDPRLAGFAELLRTTSEQTGQQPLWRRVATGPELVEELTSPPNSMEEYDAIERLAGLAFGPTDNTCLMIALTIAGREQPHRVVEAIREASREAGFQPQELKLAGSVYKAANIDRVSAETMKSRSIWSAAITMVIALLILRSVRLSLAVLLPAAFCAAVSVALVYYGGRGMNAVLIVLPTLIYVLTVSGAVHLVNYLRDAERAGSTTPVYDALSVGWKPCTLAALSTSIGMASLVISDLAPVRDFGYFSSISLCLSLAALLAMFYSLLNLWRSSPSDANETSGSKTAKLQDVSKGDHQDSPAQRRADRWSDVCANWLLRHNRVVIVLGLGALVLLGLGFRQSTSSVDMVRAFRDDHELRSNYRWIEKHLCPLGAVEVVVEFSDQCSWKPVDRLERLAEACYQLGGSADYGPAMSAATFVPPIPEASGFGGVMRRAAFHTRVKAERPQLIERGWIADANDAELWRLHVRIPETTSVEYAATVGELDRILQPIFDDSEGSVSLSYTGAYPLIAEAQEQLLWDLVASFALAFALLCPVIMLVLRSVRAGLVAMIPNVAPVVLVFGAMGWLGIPIEIGSMLTASVALGIAVDDTLHFLTWYRRSLQAGGSRPDAIREAYHRCAPAMIQTTCICGFGMLPLVGAAFVPASQFAILLIILLLAALLGDLLLLPALLASRLGAAFDPSVKGAHDRASKQANDGAMDPEWPVLEARTES